jgi:hypothetical protein
MRASFDMVELLCEMKKFDLAREFINQTGRGVEEHCVCIISVLIYCCMMFDLMFVSR